MLNISSHKTHNVIDQTEYSSLRKLANHRKNNVLLSLTAASMGLFFIILFLPWTQNIQSKGLVTTLKPDQRPQTIQTVIGGRIEKWFVQAGDFVYKGDTVLFISEIKNEYLDPDLLPRTREQIFAKEMSVAAYMDKVKAMDNQIDALLKTSVLKKKQVANKLKQAQLLVKSDSITYQASIIYFNITQAQFERMKQLNKEGLKSLTDLEKRNQTMQKSEAEMISKENKMLASINKVINAEVELSSIQAQYRQKIAKAESEKFASLSNMFNAENEVTKLQNTLANYSLRSGLYYITSPQNGYITQAMQSGIGENIKPGDEIVSIMPANFELAIAMFIKPIDLPLLEKGQPIRIQFDGWPAIIFSGWPNVSQGTYGGIVFAIDNFISENGMYRVLVEQDTADYPWPDALRVGAGTKNMVLLKDVSIGYEMWRKINGFPPDYYKSYIKTEK